MKPVWEKGENMDYIAKQTRHGVWSCYPIVLNENIRLPLSPLVANLRNVWLLDNPNFWIIRTKPWKMDIKAWSCRTKVAYF